MAHSTPFVVLGAVLALALYDVCAYLRAGGQATESTALGRWMARSLWVTVAVFALAGHLLMSGPALPTWEQYLAAGVGLAVGAFCTAF